VANADGTTGAYPGTFQWGTLFLTILVIGGIAFVIYTWLKNKRRRLSYATAYDQDDDARKSSFM
jgi:cbb3-type cytochrome oxidase subunit 3